MSGIRKVGIVVGEASPTEFLFVTEEKLPRWEYVLVRSIEDIDGNDVEVNVIAQVEKVISVSLALKDSLALDSVERILEAGLVDRRVIATARVLGFMYGGVVYQPRRAIHPGGEVYLAPESILREFYSHSEEEGLHIGYLITRPTIPVSVSVKGFRRHLAILAQTGAGKSYTAGVLMEELYKKGATIVVIDPHADYVFLSRRRDGTRLSRVSVFRTPESTGRYSEEQVGRITNYEIKFSDLTVEEIAFICNISDRWTNILKALRDTINSLGDDYTVDDLLQALASSGSGDALRAYNYVVRLKNLRVFGPATTDINRLLRPKHIAVVDLSGLEDRVADYVTYRILSAIYEQVEAQRYRYPVFVFIEEAHKFIPNEGNTYSKNIIKKIAAEGRKFGVFLTLISQRPYKIDPDALSQCNSQIIMRMTNPEDQSAVRKSSERMSENLLRDLPGLNVGEAIIVGEITRIPVMVRIRARETEEGGADIDIVEKLREASSEADSERSRQEELIDEFRAIRNMVEGV